MTYQDLLITPIYLAIFYFLAYVIRPRVTTPETKKYFIPALSAKFFGAIALGMIYQFYYSGGDTFNYFTHGSRWIWEAFLDSPITGIKLLLEQGGERQADTFNFSQNIWYYRDEKSFLIVRLVALFDLFTFHTYSATALFFAVFSFSGCWAFYGRLIQLYPSKIKALAYAILFVPTVVFWGSGILKDTITLGGLAWLSYAFLNIIVFRQNILANTVLALILAYLIFSIKSYIIICFIPTTFLWMYWKSQQGISSPVVKILIAPLILVTMAAGGYFSLQQVSSISDKYALDNIAQQAAITSYDIRYGWGSRTGGDGGYDLGTLDGSWESMITLMPSAIVVSLFRPYPWEVRNPLMLLSAMEALLVLYFTISIFRNGGWVRITNDPFILFAFTFSLLFAFAVGISTYNFGTLMRYKVPMMIYYATFLALAYKKKS